MTKTATRYTAPDGRSVLIADEAIEKGDFVMVALEPVQLFCRPKDLERARAVYAATGEDGVEVAPDYTFEGIERPTKNPYRGSVVRLGRLKGMLFDALINRDDEQVRLLVGAINRKYEGD